MSHKKAQIRLPDRVATKSQLIDLIHEIEKILEQAIQGHIRQQQTGQSFGVSKPSLSLQALLEQHQMELNVENLKGLRRELERVKLHSPSVRIILSNEPNETVKAKLVNWFRDTAGSNVMLQVGIQPGIAGGAIIYTPSHRYDMSLKTKLTKTPLNINKAFEKIESAAKKS